MFFNYQDDLRRLNILDADSHRKFIRAMRALSAENVPLNIQKSQFFCKYCTILW